MTTSSPAPEAAALTSRSTTPPRSSTSPSCWGSPQGHRHPLPLRIAFQDSGHLHQVQGISTQPRAMLGAILGLERLEPAEQDICCGSAGINIVEADPAQQGGRKARQVLATEPDGYASATPATSCRSAPRCGNLGARLQHLTLPNLWIIDPWTLANHSF
ncbi:MAG: heterodisulfide reductase-related iron-sulfur binding cluster [Solirubrobacteraceae bacterium]